jgi:hypothetical protein
MVLMCWHLAALELGEEADTFFAVRKNNFLYISSVTHSFCSFIDIGVSVHIEMCLD